MLSSQLVYKNVWSRAADRLNKYNKYVSTITIIVVVLAIDE